jgi:predicted adenylyl cyclase CyaB
VAANVETKVHCDDLAAMAAKLRLAGARSAGLIEQTDTYFRVVGARLKLREYTEHPPGESSASAAELIRYERANIAGARVSQYERTRVEDPRACRAELGARHGIRAVVTKRRDLWLLGSTRIHLDRVEGLGRFVELETIVTARNQEAACLEHARISRLLGIEPEHAIGESYGDLCESTILR